MNIQWLKCNNNSRLILFFNGWGMDSAAVEHLDNRDYDILMINDYINCEPLKNTFGSYQSVYVVAWSLGVWAASQILDKNNINIKRAIAINGTMNPIDDNQGIPKSIFEGTLTNWSQEVRKRFYMRISGGARKYLNSDIKYGNREVENQKMELAAIYRRYKDSQKSSFTFDRAIVGHQDAIFPMANQTNYWRPTTYFVTIDIPHYPFIHFTSWKQIIDI